MQTCEKCKQKNRPKCNHFLNLCSFFGCMKKPFIQGFCRCHFPKKPKLEIPTETRSNNAQKLLDSHLHFEQQRQLYIADTIARLKNEHSYYDCERNYRLENFIEQIRMETQNEQDRIEREFDETMRFFRTAYTNNFSNSDGSRNKSRNRKFKFFDRNKTSDDSDESKESKSTENFTPDEIARRNGLFVFLCIEPTTDISIIRTAYKRAAIKYHPDKNPGADAAERFIEIHDAYESIMESLVSL